jgi:hypothetical protein
LPFVTDAPGELSADPRDALIREQAEKIAVLEALVSDLREQLEAGAAGRVAEQRELLDAAGQ